MDRYFIKYPYASPYNFALNNPIGYIDIGGDSVWVANKSSSITEGNTITTTITKTIHITEALFDISDYPLDPTKLANGIESEIEKSFQMGELSTHVTGGITYVTKTNYALDISFKVVKSMSEVISQDHLLVAVDDIKEGITTNGLAFRNSQIAYIENGAIATYSSLIDASIHEILHNCGLEHTWEDNIPETADSGEGNYMSYDAQNYKIHILQIKRIIDLYEAGALNQGNNSEIVTENESNGLFDNSSNTEPYDSIVKKGEVIPRRVE